MRLCKNRFYIIYEKQKSIDNLFLMAKTRRTLYNFYQFTTLNTHRDIRRKQGWALLIRRLYARMVKMHRCHLQDYCMLHLDNLSVVQRRRIKLKNVQPVENILPLMEAYQEPSMGLQVGKTLLWLLRNIPVY